MFGRKIKKETDEILKILAYAKENGVYLSGVKCGSTSVSIAAIDQLNDKAVAELPDVPAAPWLGEGTFEGPIAKIVDGTDDKPQIPTDYYDLKRMMNQGAKR